MICHRGPGGVSMLQDEIVFTKTPIYCYLCPTQKMWLNWKREITSQTSCVESVRFVDHDH